ncbi:GNAT family N-acetyltransferase [Streptomyces sp. NPDC048290]|uniref:GNAT family N-acetyltransferase n=1 Tax=Streptomyces sp. NPDC048290 TaxID=3155811 RepID=UPI00344A82BE
MDLKRYTHVDARDVRSLLLDIHDEAYADTPDEFHSRERFSYFFDIWSSRENWLCISGWEEGRPVGYAYGSMLRPGGWWKGHPRPRDLRGSVFALSELMVVPVWRGTGRAQRIHDALIGEVTADVASLMVETERPGVQAMYERWSYAKVGEAKPSGDSPLYAVMVRKLTSGTDAGTQ